MRLFGGDRVSVLPVLSRCKDPTSPRAVLPVLADLFLHGVSEYLDDLVAQLNPSPRDCVKTMFSNQPTFGLAQLPQSIRHAERLEFRNRAEVVFHRCAVVTTLYFPAGHRSLCLHFA
jgi:hypothetical protein